MKITLIHAAALAAFSSSSAIAQEKPATARPELKRPDGKPGTLTTLTKTDKKYPYLVDDAASGRCGRMSVATTRV